MQKFVFTQFTPGHVAVPVLDKEGKPVMIVPDAKAVAAAVAANERHEAAGRKALKQSLATQNKLRGIKTPVTDAQIAKAKIAPIVRVPRVRGEVKDVIMVRNGVYELDETSARVKELVALGHLKEYVVPGNVKMQNVKM